ncbi:rhodanese-like domain-containing protein [Legionella jordanis]|uniref:Rhodanese domain protein n=1 Tax=Legionella jordanis TaxID=456 RepID=A0A0W0V9J4_9GAMM|nr:rhodanese-like domain-containing protein [Legionella pneumophila]KTD16821.1 Rhodanese domain protein [Legionella jordanis]RMW99096.1 rhodanese-like domain-containing protein [Legionella jordanis]RMX14980.1 rhodanese-like domain-containing protein [Legionella jordanis]VEH11711.1 rhodanese domain-containing protein [Legionella jordanis]
MGGHVAIKSVDAKTVKQWLEKDEVLLVDVRGPVEHAAEKIVGARLFSLSQIEKLQLPNTKTKRLVLHCRSGKRSATACQKLVHANPELEIYNLEGGIVSWIESGYPVEKTNQFTLSLEQQVQLSIGTLIFLASMLVWLISPIFIAISSLLGLCLMFTGICSYCGLASSLAKMPWNQSSKNSVTYKKA